MTLERTTFFYPQFVLHLCFLQLSPGKSYIIQNAALMCMSIVISEQLNFRQLMGDSLSMRFYKACTCVNIRN